MKKIENRCCGCDAPGYPCRGSLCDLRRVEVTYCDRCGLEIDPDSELFVLDGQELCKECYEENEEVGGCEEVYG